MPKNQNQKQKMLYIKTMLESETDREHGLSMSDLLTRLKELGIEAERKSVYDDIECLRASGMDIKLSRGKKFTYYLDSRPFETAELKLLVDAVQVAKALTVEQSRQLIKKIERLTGIHEAKKLNRHVVIQGRTKTVNEDVYEAIDAIHEAILADRKIRFGYFDWTVEKKKLLRHDGAPYHISPWALAYSDEQYYLVAYDSKEAMVKHYRVDKMVDVAVTDEARQGQEHFSDFQLEAYSNRVFGMFSGDERRITLECDNDMIGVILDRFGEDVMLIPCSESSFRVAVTVAVSTWFFSWLFGFENKVRIISPADIREEYRKKIKKTLEKYDHCDE